MIGDEIEVQVLSIDGNQVQLGIEAPRSVEVHREEVYRRIEEANVLASQLQGLERLEQVRIENPEDSEPETEEEMEDKEEKSE